MEKEGVEKHGKPAYSVPRVAREVFAKIELVMPHPYVGDERIEFAQPICDVQKGGHAKSYPEVPPLEEARGPSALGDGQGELNYGIPQLLVLRPLFPQEDIDGDHHRPEGQDEERPPKGHPPPRQKVLVNVKA